MKTQPLSRALITLTSAMFLAAPAFADDTDRPWQEQVKEDAAEIGDTAKKVGKAAKDTAVKAGSAVKGAAVKTGDKASELSSEAADEVRRQEQQRQQAAKADPERKNPAQRFIY